MTMRARQREHFLARISPELRRRYAVRYGDDYHCPSPRSDELWAALSEVADRRALMCDMRSIAAYMRRKFDARAGKQIGMFEM